MTWKKHHSKSEEYASRAEVAFSRGDFSHSEKLYQHAAKEEEIALSKLDPTKKRTIGITAVSAASLWFKGGDLQKAEEIASKHLVSQSLPSFAIVQLENILEKIRERKPWESIVDMYSQIVDIDIERNLVRLNCKLEMDSAETFERVFPLDHFPDKDKLEVDQPILVEIFERPGEVRFIFRGGQKSYFKKEDSIDISHLENSHLFKPV